MKPSTVVRYAAIATLYAPVVAPSPVALERRNLLDTLNDFVLLGKINEWVQAGNIQKSVRPANVEVHEWIAIGDSFTAGIGSNGDIDFIEPSWKCGRYRQSYPEQMNEEARWGPPSNRNLVFGACTGDLMKDVRNNQLNDQLDDDYSYFGKPELAVMSIGGNDLFFGKIIKDCIIRFDIKPLGDCATTITEAVRKFSSNEFLSELDNTLMKVIEKGRSAGGSNPPEAFQLYILGYIPFFNDEDEGCDTVCWKWFVPTCVDHFLTREFRKQLNDLILGLNKEFERAATRLRDYGVVYVEGFQDAYKGHQFCDPAVDDLTYPTSYNTWFWHGSSNWEAGEGEPRSPESTIKGQDNSSVPIQLLNALISDPAHREAVMHGANPADFSDAFQSDEKFEAALKASGDVFVGHSIKRMFHPKGTAYKHHADAVIDSILANRGAIAEQAQPSQPSQPSPSSTPTEPEKPAETTAPPPKDTCNEWYNFFFDKFEIKGKDFDREKLGDGGLKLLDHLRHCGVVSEWRFDGLKDDPDGMQWLASGRLPMGTKSCIGTAVEQIGGQAGGCTGAG